MQRKVIKVRDVMRERHLALDRQATVAQALLAMKERDFAVTIVNKRDEHDAFGIVLLSDIVRKVLARDKAPERVNLYEIMSKPLIPLDPEMDVRYCIKLFDRFGLSRAPVLENGQIIGLVSYTDIVLKGVMLQD